MKNLSQEERLLRRALLRAAEADDAQHLADAPEPPPFPRLTRSGNENF